MQKKQKQPTEPNRPFGEEENRSGGQSRPGASQEEHRDKIEDEAMGEDDEEDFLDDDE